MTMTFSKKLARKANSIGCFPIVIKSIVLSLFFCANVAIATATADNALLVIGGFDSSKTPLSNVELFGCPDNSVQVPNYPQSVILASGVFKQDDESVLVCGGNLCDADNGGCLMSSSCYTWKPKDSAWTKSIALKKPRYAHTMTYVDKPGETDGSQELITFGYHKEVEVFVKGEPGKPPSWEDYKSLEEIVVSVDCTIKNDDYFYNLVHYVKRFDLQTGKFRVISTLPEPLLRPGQCAVATIGGQPGIMTSSGYWYNLTTRVWEARAEPLFFGEENQAVAMLSFNGKPTIFVNSSQCNSKGCEHQITLQYDAKTNQWGKIGELKQSRHSFSTIEVPLSFCNASL